MADQSLTEKPKSNFNQIGRSGTLITANTIDNDYLQELLGEDGQEQYFKMLLSDSQIRKLYHAISNPIKSANWTIEPVSDEPKDLEVAALINQVIFHDIPTGFRAKLDEILTYPWHGHAVFEVIHKNRQNKNIGAYTGLANLAFRDQRSLTEWKFSNDGELKHIHQKQSGDVPVDIDLPSENLLIFYNEKKGNDNGYPFCRMLYGNYKRKLLYKQLQAIGIEKGAIGVPILKLPEGVDTSSDAFLSAKSQLELYTQAESAFIILPSGYELDLDQSNTFDPAKVQVAIKAENEEIAGSLVAMWLEMGIGGNSAVGSSTGISADFFRDGIEYLADKIADTINLELIPNIVRLNYGDEIDVLPKLTHSGIADEAGEELMKIVTGYTSAGVITVDEQLEDHIRKAHNLPKKIEGELIDNQESKEEKTEVKKPNSEELDEDEEDVELNTKKKEKTPKTLIDEQSEKVSSEIADVLKFASDKYIVDTINRYKQLPESKKQNATSKIVIAGKAKLKKELRNILTDTSLKAIDMAKKEVPTPKEIQLKSTEKDLLILTEKYGDYSEIKLNEFSKLPAHIQVLIGKQSELISEASLTEMKERLDFSFSSIETKSKDEGVIRQAMQEEANDFITSNQVNVKGTNVSSLVVNESRNTYFENDDVLDQIHSFTFMNNAPKSAICRELAGTTFNTNDVESLRYSPPLHHNCKSFLRANLKTSKGIEKLDISTLSPSAEAKKSITL